MSAGSQHAHAAPVAIPFEPAVPGPAHDEGEIKELVAAFEKYDFRGDETFRVGLATLDDVVWSLEKEGGGGRVGGGYGGHGLGSFAVCAVAFRTFLRGRWTRRSLCHPHIAIPSAPITSPPLSPPTQSHRARCATTPQC